MSGFKCRNPTFFVLTEFKCRIPAFFVLNRVFLLTTHVPIQYQHNDISFVMPIKCPDSAVMPSILPTVPLCRNADILRWSSVYCSVKTEYNCQNSVLYAVGNIFRVCKIPASYKSFCITLHPTIPCFYGLLFGIKHICFCVTRLAHHLEFPFASVNMG